MKSRPLKIILCLFILLTSIKSLYALDINTEAKKLYYEACKLIEETEIPSRDNFNSAFNKLGEAIQKEPKFYEAYIALGKAYWDYGIIYVGQKKENLQERDVYSEKARENLKKAISIAPNRPEAYHHYYYMVKGKERENIQKKLYEIDPDNPDVMNWKGYDLINEGKVTEGMELVLKSINLSHIEPGDQRGRKRKLSKILKEKGYHKEAQEVSEIATMEEKVEVARLKIAWGQIDEGLKILKDGLKNNYKNIKKVPERESNSLIKILVEKGLFKEVADIYEAIDPVKHKDKIKELREKAK